MPQHDYPDAIEPVSKDQSLAAVRDAAKKRFEAQVLKAYAELDEGAVLQRVQDDVVRRLEEVTKSMLGIDDRWSAIELKEGGLRRHLEPIMERLLQEKVKPMFEAEVARLLEQKTIKTALNKAIKRRVESAVYGIENHRTDATNDFEKLISAEIEKTMREFLQ